MAADIAFYQLAQRPIEAVAPALVVKARAAGLRLLLRSADQALLARLDDALWQLSPTSFVPHGLASALPAERIASQPVLLSETLAADGRAANGADCLMQLEGQLPDALGGFRRVLWLFGEAELEAARARWRALKAEAGVALAFWREGQGGGFERAG